MTINELKKRYSMEYTGRLICPVCGSHKTHYRIGGYRCHFHQHTEREHAFTIALVEAVTSGQISQEEYDIYCFGD